MNVYFWQEGKKGVCSFKMDRTLAAPQEDAQIDIGHKLWCVHNFWVNCACCCAFRRWMDSCWFYLQLKEHACTTVENSVCSLILNKTAVFSHTESGFLYSWTESLYWQGRENGHRLKSFHIQPRLGCICQPFSSMKVKLRGAADDNAIQKRQTRRKILYSLVLSSS